MDAASIYKALLAGRFEMPAYITPSGRRMMPLIYKPSDVSARVDDRKRDAIDEVALTDPCEAGRMLAEVVRAEAMALAEQLAERLKEEA